MDYQLILFLGFVFLVIVAIRIAPGTSKLKRSKSDSYFPIVSGRNLDRKEIEFPKEFSKGLNLIIIAFKRYQQEIVDSWVPSLTNLELTYPNFTYFELPTLDKMSMLYRSFLNEGMRAGIPDRKARRQTITLYLDKNEFKHALGMNNEDEIYLYLVTEQGKILWRETGGYDPRKEKVLRELLENGG